MVTDITERKQAEEHLTRISKAVESTSDGIGIADIYRKSTYHNQAFVNLYGYTVDELDAAGGPPAMYAQSEIAEQVLESILKVGHGVARST
jgi:PAS domain S-box-containing protein